MNNPDKSLVNKTSSSLSHQIDEGNARAAILLASFIAGFNGLGAVTSLLIPAGGSEGQAQAFVSLFMLVFNLSVIWLIRTKKYTSAVILMQITQFIQCGIIQNLRQAGTGYIWALFLIITAYVFAILLLPQNRIRWGLVVGNFLGFTAMAIDFFMETASKNTLTLSRPQAEGQTLIFILVFIGALLLGELVILLRRWNSFSYDTKTIISFTVAAELVAIIVQLSTIAFAGSANKSLIAFGLNNTQASMFSFSNIQGIMFACNMGVFFACLLSMVFSRSLIRQVLVMSQEVEIVATSGDVRRLIQVTAKDEVGRLGEALQGLVARLASLADTAKRLAQGDLTVDVSPLSPQDELGLAFVEMVRSLHASISGVNAETELLAETSRSLAEAAQQSGEATSQIAGTLQQVSSGISQQSLAVNRTAGSVDQLAEAIDSLARGSNVQAQSVAVASGLTGKISQEIQQVAGNAKAVSQTSNQASLSAQDGAQKVQLAVKGMERIRQTVGESAAKVQEMGRRSNEISAIVETIEDIASQTNMLALNAAIEAARAGESGKGFAVVAEEVRKLAGRAAEATREIGGLVRGIQTAASEAEASMEQGGREVANGMQQGQAAGQALEAILKSVESVRVQAESASQAAARMNASADDLVKATDRVSVVVEENRITSEHMAANVNEVAKAVENIASVSQENSAAVEEVTASTEEITAQAQEVAASAATAKNIVSTLKDVIATFQLD